MATRANRIIHGDCLKELERIEAGSIDLVFADPPFNIGYDYDEYDDKRSRDDYLDWSQRWMSLVIRVLKPDGTFWLAIGDEYAAELKVAATRELGLTCRNWVVWYYTFGVHCTHKFTRSHAHLFYFVKDPKHFTFNANAIRVPSARQLVYGDRRANPMGRVPDDTWMIAPPGTKGRRDVGWATPTNGSVGWATPTNGSVGWATPTNGSVGWATPTKRDGGTKGRGDEGTKENDEKATERRSDEARSSFILRPQDLPDGFTPDGDTWYFPRVCGTFKERGGFHGCQMPEQLLGRIIKACSNEGDLVLDPFTGTGTTAAVAKKLGRDYLGIELSKQYVTESTARLSGIEPGDPLDGIENPLTSVADTASGIIRTPDGKRVKRDGTPVRRGRPKKSESADAQAKLAQTELWT